METPVVTKPKDRMEDTKEFVSTALDSLTNEMVVEMAGKAVSAVEMVDDIMQPETISLLRKLPEVSKSLENTLNTVQTLEENGTLKTLTELGEMAATMKASMTNMMVVEMVEKAITGVELADDLLQQGGLELVQGMSTAFAKAREERAKADGPLGLMQIARSMKDPDVREGLSLMIAFLKALPSELNK